MKRKVPPRKVEVTASSFNPKSSLQRFRFFLGGSILILLLESGVARADFMPPQSSNLQLWFKADAGVTTGTANRVSAWADQSGHGYDARQNPNAPTYAPVYMANALNGLPLLSFDGAFNHLFISNSIDLTAGLSIFIVAKHTVREDYNGLFRISSGTNPSTIFVANNGDLSLYWQKGNTDTASGNALYAAHDLTSVQANDVPPAVGNPYVFDVIANTLSATMRVNETNYTGTSTGTGFLPLSANPAVLGVGYGGGTIPGLHGYMAEVLVYNTTLSAADRDTVESYLFAKWVAPAAIPEPSTAGCLIASACFAAALARAQLRRKASRCL